MSKHTKGPWTFHRASRENFNLLQVHGDWSQDKESSVEVCADIREEADARLISCAPEMLRLLKELSEAGIRNTSIENEVNSLLNFVEGE